MFDKTKPFDINWELNNICNLFCPQCGRNEIVDGKIQWRDLPSGARVAGLNTVDNSLETFKTVYRNIGHPVRTIRFQGHLSENVLSKDFLEICQWIYDETDSYIHISTHGSANTPDWWRRLGSIFSDMGDDAKVFFSLDGSEQDTLENYRVGANFNKIIDNARAFIEGGGYAVWRMIIFKHNQHQVDDARAMSHLLGFKNFVSVHTQRRHAMNERWTYKGQDYILENQDISDEWNDAVDNNGQYGEIQCKAVDENQFYIDHYNRVWACYYIPNIHKLAQEANWYGEYMQKKASLLDTTLDDILEDEFYERLTSSWHRESTCLSMCRKHCSKEHGVSRGFAYDRSEHPENYSGQSIQKVEDYI